MARVTFAVVPTYDGVRLAVAYFDPFQKTVSSRVVVVNAGAGVPKSFYSSFASWLADQGISVVVYDYRGIGNSRGGSIRKLTAEITDWGSKDCAAALDATQARYPGARISLIGHSIGSIVIGFVKKTPNIERMVLISPHTGYFGDYARTGKLGMFLRWHVMMPFVTRLMGYFPGRSFGLPEDLPYGIAMGWAKRRFARDTIEDAKDGLFSHIASTALIIRPEDDPFATMDAALRVQNHFPNTRFYDYLLRVPAGDHAIGHFGFFHPRSRQTAWTVALEWLAQAAPNAPMR